MVNYGIFGASRHHDDEDGMTSGSLRKPAEKPNAEGEDEDEDDEDEGTLDFSDLNAS